MPNTLIFNSRNMMFRLFFTAILSIVLFACHTHSHDHPDSDHDEHTHEQEGHKFLYTAYSDDFEVFAEADPFVVGEKAELLAHFSSLPDFRALESGRVSMVLKLEGNEISQSLEAPLRKGIYLFEIQADRAGEGSLRFEIEKPEGLFTILVPGVKVFASQSEGEEAAESLEISEVNTTVFTREQAWKTDFASGHPRLEAFGQIIKTTALVEPAIDQEWIVSASASGIALFSAGDILEGKEVQAGQPLIKISGKGVAENSLAVRYAEAASNYERSKAEYERAKVLAQDQIVSAKDLMAVRNEYEKAKARFDNLSESTDESGQSVSSPTSGYVQQVFVKHGAYVEGGQPLMVISRMQKLMLSAELPPRFAPLLGSIRSANIRNLNNHQYYTLEELDGRLLSYGKAMGSGRFLLPLKLQIVNNGSFIPGSFVEVYLKTFAAHQAMTLPLTALLEEQGLYFVWVQLTPELFEKREVRIGAEDGIRAEILSGITEEERIVTRGAMMIKLAQATGGLDPHAGHFH